MKIQHNFYTEMREEWELYADKEETSSTAQDPEALFQHVLRARQMRRIQQSALEMSISKNDFQHMVDDALDLADHIGLDFFAKTEGTLGMISLSAPRLTLNKRSDFEYISRLTRIWHAASESHTDNFPKGGENYVRFSLYYDLIL